MAIKSFPIIELPVVTSDAIGVLFGWRIEQILSLLFVFLKVHPYFHLRGRVEYMRRN